MVVVVRVSLVSLRYYYSFNFEYIFIFIILVKGLPILLSVFDIFLSYIHIYIYTHSFLIQF